MYISRPRVAHPCSQWRDVKRNTLTFPPRQESLEIHIIMYLRAQTHCRSQRSNIRNKGTSRYSISKTYKSLLYILRVSPVAADCQWELYVMRISQAPPEIAAAQRKTSYCIVNVICFLRCSLWEFRKHYAQVCFIWYCKGLVTVLVLVKLCELSIT